MTPEETKITLAEYKQAVTKLQQELAKAMDTYSAEIHKIYGFDPRSEITPEAVIELAVRAARQVMEEKPK